MFTINLPPAAADISHGESKESDLCSARLRRCYLGREARKTGGLAAGARTQKNSFRGLRAIVLRRADGFSPAIIWVLLQTGIGGIKVRVRD